MRLPASPGTAGGVGRGRATQHRALRPPGRHARPHGGKQSGPFATQLFGLQGFGWNLGRRGSVRSCLKNLLRHRFGEEDLAGAPSLRLPTPLITRPGPQAAAQAGPQALGGLGGAGQTAGKAAAPLTSQATAGRSPLFHASCSSAMMSAGAPVKRLGNQVSEPRKTQQRSAGTEHLVKTTHSYYDSVLPPQSRAHSQHAIRLYKRLFDSMPSPPPPPSSSSSLYTVQFSAKQTLEFPGLCHRKLHGSKDVCQVPALPRTSGVTFRSIVGSYSWMWTMGKQSRKEAGTGRKGFLSTGGGICDVSGT